MHAAVWALWTTACPQSQGLLITAQSRSCAAVTRHYVAVNEAGAAGQYSLCTFACSSIAMYFLSAGVLHGVWQVENHPHNATWRYGTNKLSRAAYLARSSIKLRSTLSAIKLQDVQTTFTISSSHCIPIPHPVKCPELWSSTVTCLPQRTNRHAAFPQPS